MGPYRKVFVAAATILSMATAAAGCSKPAEEVQVDYRPVVGTTYRYELTVSSVTVTRLDGEQPERSTDEALLEATDTVLDSGPDGVRVRVDLRRAGSPMRSFVVRFDRGAQLSGVEAVEGLPAEILGPLAFPELLPAAAAAPPRKALSPGEKWTIGAEATLPDGSPVRIEGTGELDRIMTVDGTRLASIKAQTRLPLSSTTTVRGVSVALNGVETTDSVASRSVVDGSVRDATSVTKADFDLTLNGPGGEGSSPIRGTMTVEVESTIRLLETVAPAPR